LKPGLSTHVTSLPLDFESFSEGNRYHSLKKNAVEDRKMKESKEEILYMWECELISTLEVSMEIPQNSPTVIIM